MDRKNYRLVKIYWIDPTSIDAWTELDEALDYEPHEICSAGFLIGETPDCYVLASNIDLNSDDVSAVMIVPKRALVKEIEVVSG